jgi:hypothetical protein
VSETLSFGRLVSPRRSCRPAQQDVAQLPADRAKVERHSGTAVAQVGHEAANQGHNRGRDAISAECPTQDGVQILQQEIVQFDSG